VVHGAVSPKGCDTGSHTAWRQEGDRETGVILVGVGSLAPSSYVSGDNGPLKWQHAPKDVYSPELMLLGSAP